MGALKPLATISILAVMGVFLAMKIQQDRNLPPIAESEEAPAFSSTDSPSDEAPPFVAAPTANSQSSVEPRTAPAVTPPKATTPALPPLPTLPAPLPTKSPTAPLESAPEKPRYDGIAAPQPIAPPAISGRVPSLGTATPDVPAATPPPTVTKTPSVIAPAPITSAPAPSVTTPAPAPVGPEMTAAPSIAPMAATSGYAAARPVIQAALDRNELPRAHLLLTQWYGDPSLTADEKREVQQLLSELAGSVVYSTENLLEPAYQVKPGDTLESIAAQYSVPWELLAKINGIPQANAVQPGQTVKVLRGPFKAVIDVSDRELVLILADRYAGKFPVEIQGAAANDSQWKVEQKLLEPSQSANPYAGYDPNVTPAYDRRIVLRDPSAATVELVAKSTVSPAAAPYQGRIAVASSDVEDLYDILSVGSEVVVRR
jgi:LysM repeat protein